MHTSWLVLDNLHNLLTFTSLNFLNCKKQICMGGFLWGLQIVHELLPCPDSANKCQYHISLITQIIIAQIITAETLLCHKGLSTQGYRFSNNHVWMWELDYKESWVPQNWCFWTVVLEKTLESPLDCKEIQPVHPKENQSWIFTGRSDVEAETPILWPPDAKSWLIGKDPDAGKDWRQEEKGTAEDEMLGWHHRLDRHEFEQVLGVGDRQGSLACCSPWGHK